MDRGIRSLTDPVARAPYGERRRNIRQKLHTPVYASFNGPQAGMVVDLSELLDLHEEGFAVQTSQRLEVNRAVTVCLDLPETKSYIHSTGQVIWSDDSGRGGIRFSGLPEKSRQLLKEWLFLNLMIGCSNQAARNAQLAGRDETHPEPLLAAESPNVVQKSVPSIVPNTVPISSGSALISAVEAVRLVVRDLGGDLDAILQLVTERALSFTGASGAALAFLTDGKMVCRARAGGSAPPLEAPVDAEHGLTGVCIRMGLLVSCEDTENDSRVDPEVCGALGISSLMAAPIVSDLQTIGLLEIFSPRPRSFTNLHATILERLVELIPRTCDERTEVIEVKESPLLTLDAAVSDRDRDSIRIPAEELREPALREPAQREQPFRQESETVSEDAWKNGSEATPQVPARLLYRALLGLAIVVVFLVLGYVLAPVIDRHWAVAPQASQPASSALSKQTGPDAGSQTKYLIELQNLAEQGNAEAQWQLGIRYHNGEGVARDDVLAMGWFQRAAEQGNVTAQATLGAYYLYGRGVPQDLTKAYFWSALAVAQGDENSKARLEGLASQMTPEQITAAHQQAELWIQSHQGREKSAAN